VPIESVQYDLTMKDETEQAVHAVESLCHILSEASPVLLDCLHEWLFTREEIRTTGPHFSLARKELLELAGKHRFERDDLQYLLRRENWRRNFEPTRKKYFEYLNPVT